MTRALLAAAASLAGLVVACSGPADAPVVPPQPVAAGATPTPTAVATTTAPPASTTPELPPLTTSDAGPPPVGGACAPTASVSPTVKPWKAPHALRRNVCTPQEAAAIVQCFVSQQNCQVLVSAACHACAVSGDATPYSSALISSQAGQPAELNVEGCVAALAGDTSATGCGPKLQARFECAGAACTACTDDTQRTTCLQQADTTVCSTQNQAAACATPYLGQCVQGTTEVEVAFNLVKIFCGP